jgi:glycosyltransferase involved in cell wall biosynthesis
MRVIAVIPAYHEGLRAWKTVRAVLNFVDEVIVVDDGSRDETASQARLGGAVVLSHAINRGQGAALRTGTEAALLRGADIIVHVDADGQHDPKMIPSLVAPIRENRADIVFGSRFLGIEPSDMPAGRRLFFVLARTFNTLCLGIPRSVTDPQSGARALSRASAEAIDFRQDRMAHCSEILRIATRSGLRWTEVPVHVRYTADTIAKGQRLTNAVRIAWELLVGIARK